MEGLIGSSPQGSRSQSQLGDEDKHDDRISNKECLRPQSGLGYSCARARTRRSRGEERRSPSVQKSFHVHLVWGYLATQVGCFRAKNQVICILILYTSSYSNCVIDNPLWYLHECIAAYIELGR
jgi:hypothetical protein